MTNELTEIDIKIEKATRTDRAYFDIDYEAMTPSVESYIQSKGFRIEMRMTMWDDWYRIYVK